MINPEQGVFQSMETFEERSLRLSKKYLTELKNGQSIEDNRQANLARIEQALQVEGLPEEERLWLKSRQEFLEGLNNPWLREK